MAKSGRRKKSGKAAGSGRSKKPSRRSDATPTLAAPGQQVLAPVKSLAPCESEEPPPLGEGHEPASITPAVPNRELPRPQPSEVSHPPGLSEACRESQEFHAPPLAAFPPTDSPSFPVSQSNALGWRGFAEVWSQLWETDPAVAPVQITSNVPSPKVRRFAPAFLASTLIHGCAVVFVASIPPAVLHSWFAGPTRTAVHPDMVVYEFRHLTLPPYLPAMIPKSRGMPFRAPVGQGANLGAHPRVGGSHFDPRITITSNPPHPDNFRTTLQTENALPDLKPPVDVRLPDLISGGPTPAPVFARISTQATSKTDQNSVAALGDRRNLLHQGPTVTDRRHHESPNAFTPAEEPSRPEKPNSVAAKLPEVPSPVALVKPAAPPPPPALRLASKLPDLASPHLEVPPPPPPEKNLSPAVAEAARVPPPKVREATTGIAHAAPDAPPSSLPGSKSATAPTSETPNSAGGPTITALSVDPVPVKNLAVIPAGTRAGAFSISPAGGVTGVPGGQPGAPPDVGKGEHGPGGERSVAAGNGNPDSGGGHRGQSLSDAANVSVSGAAGLEGISAGALAPLKAEDLVYDVTADTPKARAPSMVVSSGSWGGGGLRLFGVLHGDKIYTVYFPMPGRSWILQYCAQTTPPHVDAAARLVQIHFDPPLTPPAAIKQFDFHRPSSPPDPANSMIILHGVIHEDGSVSDLVAVQSFDAASSAASRAAFSRWKFKPALRASVPVPIEILVGIP